MPRCWREVVFLFMQHEYKIRCWQKLSMERYGAFGMLREIAEQEQLISKGEEGLKCNYVQAFPQKGWLQPFKPKIHRAKRMSQQSKASFFPISYIAHFHKQNPFFNTVVLSFCHTYGPCPLSMPNGSQLRKVILSPGVNLSPSLLCCATVLGWDLFRCRDDRRKTMKQQSMCGGWPSHPITMYLCSFF